MSEQVVVMKVDQRCLAMGLLEEGFERERNSNNLRYHNLNAFV